MKFGVLGSGPVGQVLAKGLLKHGYEVRIGSRSPTKLAEFSSSSGIASGTFADVSAWAEGLVLAVQGRGAEEALKLAGAKDRKSTRLNSSHQLISYAVFCLK